MAREQYSSTRPWILDAAPLFVIILIAAHVLALISKPETATAEAKGSLKEKYQVINHPWRRKENLLLTALGNWHFGSARKWQAIKF